MVCRGPSKLRWTFLADAVETIKVAGQPNMARAISTWLTSSAYQELRIKSVVLFEDVGLQRRGTRTLFLRKCFADSGAKHDLVPFGSAPKR
jgi:hypothetical protein